MKSAAEDEFALINGLGFPGERFLRLHVAGLFFKACMLIGLFVNLKALDCLRAASFAFVSFLLAVFRAEAIVNFFKACMLIGLFI